METITNQDDAITGKQKKILIVGDWVVDDYWVIVNHRSKSSRTGLMHHRALHKRAASIRAFCGAGQTASILHNTRLQEDSIPLYKILGLGLWAVDDDDGLLALFNPENTKFHNPYRIFKTFDKNLPNRVELVNLGDYLIHSTDDNNNIEFGTTRIIRTYLKVGNKTTQLQRIDWELEPPSVNGLPEWPVNIKNLSSKLDPDVDCVVIKDLGKGVINDKLIQLLIKKYSRVPWFISTKSWKPRWLIDHLHKIPLLRLLLIPQIAAQTALQEDDVNSWITNTGYASNKALDELTKLRKKMSKDAKPIIIVLPKNLSTLALDLRPDDDEQTGVIFPDDTPKLALETNMASVFFGAAISQLLEDNSNGITISKLIEQSLNYTYNWQEKEIKRIVDPDLWDPKSSPAIILNDLAEKIKYPINNEPFNVKHAKDEWTAALNSLERGIVTDENGNEKFELWRSMVDVPEYVCCVDFKQRNIRKLVHAVNDYAKGFKSMGDRIPQVRAPQTSCLLFAKAGAGKTSLVRKLADSNNLRFIPYNITQMNRLIDILDCFDTIVTSSLQDPHRPLLIFIDEINALLENEDVYKVFLSPLEDGMYIRDGKAYKLPPSFWVFASTESEQEIKAKSKSKASDFCSRLTHGTISLEIPVTDDDNNSQQKQLENVYFGVSMILSIFPDIRQVSKTVLDIFAKELKTARMREMRHFIEAFKSVQYGKITASNIPVFIHDNIKIDDNAINDYLAQEVQKPKMIPIISAL